MGPYFPLRELYQFLLLLAMSETARSSIAMSIESAIKLLDYCQSKKLKMAFEVVFIFGLEDTQCLASCQEPYLGHVEKASLGGQPQPVRSRAERPKAGDGGSLAPDTLDSIS